MAQEIKFKKLFINIILLLKRKRIPYMVVGGLAVNYFGEPRFTKDIDLVIVIEPDKKDAFIKALHKNNYKFNDKTIGILLKASNMFEIYDQTEVYRIDFWLPKTYFEKKAFSRRVLKGWGGKKIYFSTPEDLIMFKLLAGRPKDILDVKGILSRQKGKLDREYLRFWAKALNIYKKLKRLEKD